MFDDDKTLRGLTLPELHQEYKRLAQLGDLTNEERRLKNKIDYLIRMRMAEERR